MSVLPPPIYDIMADDQGKARIPYVLFFNQLFQGDSGTEWDPTFQNLTTVGTPEITGRYYRLSNYLYVFRINITPATSTTATAGTTYCDNFPLIVSDTGFCLAVGGTLGVGLGVVQGDTSRVYVPSWSAVTVPLSIIGMVEVA